MKPQFKIGDRVQTNLLYVNGFDANHSAPSGLKWLKDLKITNVIDCGEASTELSNNKASRFAYECKSKSRQYIINEIFLDYENNRNTTRK